MKKTIGVLVVVCSLASLPPSLFAQYRDQDARMSELYKKIQAEVAQSKASSAINLGKMRVFDVLGDNNFAASLGLAGIENKQDRILIDCEDGRAPRNSLLFLRSSQILNSKPQTLYGVSDFYCQQLKLLTGAGRNRQPLKAGDDVEVILETSGDATGGKAFTVVDIKLIPTGGAAWIYKKPDGSAQAGGISGNFVLPQ